MFLFFSEFFSSALSIQVVKEQRYSLWFDRNNIIYDRKLLSKVLLLNFWHEIYDIT